VVLAVAEFRNKKRSWSQTYYKELSVAFMQNQLLFNMDYKT